MLQRPIIKSLLGGFILLLFTFSMIPRKLLHDAVTDHVEFAAKSGAADSQFHSDNRGIACKCENLFAQPVFVVLAQVFELVAPVRLQSIAETFPDKFYTYHRFFFELRGPPALA